MINELEADEISQRLIDREKSITTAAALAAPTMLSTQGETAWGPATQLDAPVRIQIGRQGFYVRGPVSGLPSWVLPSIRSMVIVARNVDFRAIKYTSDILPAIMTESTPAPSFLAFRDGVQMKWRTTDQLINVIVPVQGAATFYFEDTAGKKTTPEKSLPADLRTLVDALTEAKPSDPSREDPAMIPFSVELGPARTHEQRSSLLRKNFVDVEETEYFGVPEDLL